MFYTRMDNCLQGNYKLHIIEAVHGGKKVNWNLGENKF